MTQMTHSEKTKQVARILKKRIPSLSSEEAVHIAYVIVESLEKTNKATNE